MLIRARAYFAKHLKQNNHVLTYVMTLQTYALVDIACVKNNTAACVDASLVHLISQI